MKHKSTCVVDIKPKTILLTFCLKDPNDMELDTNPKIENRKPDIVGVEAKQYRYRDYIGMNDKNQLQFKYSILIKLLRYCNIIG